MKTQRKCSTCKIVLEASETQCYCKPCRNERTRRQYKERNGIQTMRAHHLRRTYGITLEQYEAMAEQQNHRCAICGQPETTTKKGTLQSLAVDHCHDTSKVRGLLCHHCNVGIGSLKHRKDLLLAAIRYLEETSEKVPNA